MATVIADISVISPAGIEQIRYHKQKEMLYFGGKKGKVTEIRQKGVQEGTV